ncbi:MAG: arginase family protein [Paracoccaceae bacterium]
MALEDAQKIRSMLPLLRYTDPRGLAYEKTHSGCDKFPAAALQQGSWPGVDLAVTGVPFDQAVTHRPGTRFGPRAIREASTLQAFDAPYGWGYDPLSNSIVDYGDLAFDYAHTASFPTASPPISPGSWLWGRGDHAGGRSLHYLADPARLCRGLRTHGADPVRRTFRYLDR